MSEKVFDVEYFLEWWSKQEDSFLELEPEEAARAAFLAGRASAQQSVQPTPSVESDDPKPGTQSYVDAVTSKGG